MVSSFNLPAVNESSNLLTIICGFFLSPLRINAKFLYDILYNDATTYPNEKTVWNYLQFATKSKIREAIQFDFILPSGSSLFFPEQTSIDKQSVHVRFLLCLAV
ncbi:hypothetical protein NPIL_454591 [Nephila pilipes]|uniref:Uncharacterized protein n=1 Tax=Nephila pilipes TaxID=299642 RepID=A0A8X6TYZ0_NEPPI|nr:hypothetical protein NPIL_454591 [Nephila pilipes]